MIWQIIKKQCIVFIRNPQQLFLLLLLPIILIVILSVSLSSFMEGETIQIDANVAMIEHADEQEQLEQFLAKIEESNIPDEAKQQITMSLEQLSLITLIKEILTDVDFVELKEISVAEKEKVLNDDEFAVVLEFPETFLVESYEAMYLDESELGTIKLYENKGHPLAANAVKTIVYEIQEQIMYGTFAEKNGVDIDVLKQSLETEIGKIETVNQSEKISSKEYYTVGMAVMNTLFIAGAVGSFAFMEKQLQVFNRIILSDMSRWSYFIGVFLSGTIFSLFQLFILFGFSWIVYGITWDILSWLVVTVFLALSVGGLSVLLAAISYRSNSETVINMFSTMIVSILALLGGSFFPIGDYSSFIQTLGDFTPNGAAMTSYLSLLRGESVTQLTEQLFRLMLFTVVLLLAAIASFPKRGQI